MNTASETLTKLIIMMFQTTKVVINQHNTITDKPSLHWMTFISRTFITENV